MKSYILFLSVMVCLAIAPSAGFAEVIVGDLDVVESADVVVAAPVEVVPVEVAPAPVDPVVEPAIEPVPVEDLSGSIATPTSLMVVMAAITPMVIELVKLIPGTAPWMLRILAVIVGMLGGLFVGLGWFGAVSYNIGVAILSGAAGGAGFTAIKWGSQAVRSGNRPAGFASIRAMLLLGISGVLLLCMIGLSGCGTTFTAKTGEPTITSIHRGPPGQMIAKVADKIACTVNSAPGDEMLISNPCKPGYVPWYEGVIVDCIPNPCTQGVLTHNPDGTVGCK